MAIPSHVLKAAASKFNNIAAPSIQSLLLCPSTHFFQSPAADPLFFNLPQPETKSVDSPKVHMNRNLREISFSMNLSPPLGYSAARIRDFSDSDDDDERDPLEYVGLVEGDFFEDHEIKYGFGDENENENENEKEDEDEDGDEDEIRAPRRSRK